MGYRAFYCCYKTNETLSAEEACEMDLSVAADRILELLQGDEDFFGLIDDHNTTLQFLRNGDTIWIRLLAADGETLDAVGVSLRVLLTNPDGVARGKLRARLRGERIDLALDSGLTDGRGKDRNGTSGSGS